MPMLFALYLEARTTPPSCVSTLWTVPPLMEKEDRINKKDRLGLVFNRLLPTLEQMPNWCVGPVSTTLVVAIYAVHYGPLPAPPIRLPGILGFPQRALIARPP